MTPKVLINNFIDFLSQTFSQELNVFKKTLFMDGLEVQILFKNKEKTGLPWAEAEALKEKVGDLLNVSLKKFGIVNVSPQITLKEDTIVLDFVLTSVRTSSDFSDILLDFDLFENNIVFKHTEGDLPTYFPTIESFHKFRIGSKVA